MCRYSVNPYRTDDPAWEPGVTTAFRSEDVLALHRSIPAYAPTPLISLEALAHRLGVSSIHVKDESHRFGLKAFKGLGASYAIYRFIKDRWEKKFGVQFELDNLYRSEQIQQLNLPPFCTATDGNHGRAVAWFSRLIGHRAAIYMPAGTVQTRIDNIRSEGAEVTVIDGDYDETVRRVAADAEQNGWQVISDTSYPGYTQIPMWIMAGYTTMFAEVDAACDESFSHVFLQSGVGSFAAAAAWYYFERTALSPLLVSVEPLEADCLLESVAHGGGEMRTSRGSAETIMAGLNCGTPSLVAWPLIRDRFSLFLAVSDQFGRQAMRRYYHPEESDTRIISGESGSAGLAALLALDQSESLSEARGRLGLDKHSRILLFNTEGDTDPESFQRVVSQTE